MYNDEKNLYHYTYRKDGSEPTHTPDPDQSRQAVPTIDDQLNRFQAQQNGPQQPIQEMKPVKKDRSGAKLVALALACALLGGAVGGGIVWGVGRGTSSATVQVSDRTVQQVAVKTVNGKDAMTDAEIYAANVNSVVSINTTGTSGTNIVGQPVQSASSGSGFILTEDGYIATNYHVVENAQTMKVTLYNGDQYDAAYVGGDEEYDLAVIKVDAAALQPVILGNSDDLNVGDHVVAIGNPLGELTFSLSEGTASSVNRAINVQGIPFNMIQVTATVNPGNSGGPLFNQYGEVVGIVSAKYTSYANENVEGLGFAIPINDVRAMIEDIMTNGYISNKPYLGITPQTLNAQMAAQFQFNIDKGVFICSVEEGCAADQAGLRMGDVITKVDDTQVDSVKALNAAKKQYAAGDTATLTVYREGQTITVDITWGATPEEQQPQQTQPQQDTQSGVYIDPFDMFNYFFGNR